MTDPVWLLGDALTAKTVEVQQGLPSLKAGREGPPPQPGSGRAVGLGKRSAPSSRNGQRFASGRLATAQALRSSPQFAKVTDSTRGDRFLVPSRSLPNLPHRVKQYMGRKQLLNDISAARENRDAESLRSLLQMWPSGKQSVPEQVALAKSDIARWDAILQYTLPQLLDAIDQQDIAQVRHRVEELESSGPRSFPGLKEAKSLLSRYDRSANDIYSAVVTKDVEGVQHLLASWDFPGDSDVHDCLKVAQTLLMELSEEEQGLRHASALSQLQQLISKTPHDLLKMRKAVECWPFAEDATENSTLTAATEILDRHKHETRAALASRDGWALRWHWEASSSGLALGDEVCEELTEQVAACFAEHEDVVDRECQLFKEQRLKFRDQNFLTWLPGLVKATSKTGLAEALQDLDVTFWPRSWCYPKQSIHEICEAAFTNSRNSVIVKPSLSSQGWGISIASSADDLRRQLGWLREEEALIQEYVDRPLLLNACKWDLRLYVLIIPCRANGLVSYLAHEGLARVAAQPYQHVEPRNQHRLSAHLTNYSVAKYSPDFDHGGRPQDGRHGCKRSLSAVFRELETAMPGFSTTAMWAELRSLTHQTIRLTLEPWLISTCSQQSAGGEYFHLLGLDVLLDENLTPWLLEINTKPSLDFDEVRSLSVGQTRAEVNQLFLKGSRRSSFMAGRKVTRWGQPCRCGAIGPVHTHQPCPTDLVVKGAVMKGALSIARANASSAACSPKDCAKDTIFEPTA